MHVPLASLNGDALTIAPLKKSKDKPVVVACAAGMHAPKAISMLKEKGFTSLFGLQGGMQAWQKEALPVE